RHWAAGPMEIDEGCKRGAQHARVSRKYPAHPVLVEDVEAAPARSPLARRPRGNVFGAQIPLDGGKTRADARGFRGGATTPGNGRPGGEHEHWNDEAGSERDFAHGDLRDTCYFTTIFLVTRLPSMTSW